MVFRTADTWLGAVHHWDEYGLANMEDEPEDIQKIHREMIEFVKHWIKDWKPKPVMAS